MNKCSQFIFAGLLIAAVALRASCSYAAEIDAESVKATLITKFALDTKWPPESAITSHSKVNVCVIGDAETGKLNKVFRSALEAFGREYALISDVKANAVSASCNIVFIRQSEEPRIRDILAGLAGKPILTIGDMENFAQKGGMIELAFINKNVKVSINNKAAREAKFVIGADLLGIARNVID
ncbi:MAG: YfiR family protein [Alphaproteobacteria bacterium]